MRLPAREAHVPAPILHDWAHVERAEHQNVVAGPKIHKPRRLRRAQGQRIRARARDNRFDVEDGQLVPRGVFDPTGGEGTTGEACVKLGRRFIGCELGPKYHAAGVERIKRAANGLKQTELFA